jgi:hypothetical protein
MFDEAVMAACLAFFPAVFEERVTTNIYVSFCGGSMKGVIGIPFPNMVPPSV